MRKGRMLKVRRKELARANSTEASEKYFSHRIGTAYLSYLALFSAVVTLIFFQVFGEHRSVVVAIVFFGQRIRGAAPVYYALFSC